MGPFEMWNKKERERKNDNALLRHSIIYHQISNVYSIWQLHEKSNKKKEKEKQDSSIVWELIILQ